MEYLEYGEEELSFLRGADPVLAEVIDKVGMLKMPVDPDLYTALVRNVIGQQITIAIYERTWAEFQRLFGEVPDPRKVMDAGVERLRAMGIPYRRAEYIIGISDGVVSGTIDERKMAAMDDDTVFKALDSIRGIGPWTAEMTMLFYLRRRNVFSFLDVALIRGLKRMYGLDEVTKKDFEVYRSRFSPYCSVASLYIWEVGEGRVSVEHRDIL
ncbi:MAG: DNA-3-methyladenine glycosylase 2 family protein [archaeon]|nr:DNA-3-methyladenine glycosylase 2 family protein [archaeon]